jgi:hypothetical protein
VSKKLSPKKQKALSAKIRKLVLEGYPHKQAAAIAYKYLRDPRYKVGPRGGLKRKNPSRIVSKIVPTYIGMYRWFALYALSRRYNSSWGFKEHHQLSTLAGLAYMYSGITHVVSVPATLLTLLKLMGYPVAFKKGYIIEPYEEADVSFGKVPNMEKVDVENFFYMAAGHWESLSNADLLSEDYLVGGIQDLFAMESEDDAADFIETLASNTKPELFEYMVSKLAKSVHY